MKKRWIGYAVWLLMAAGLYFFENNTGTRIIFFCSLCFPFLTILRRSIWDTDETPEDKTHAGQTKVRSICLSLTDGTGDIRSYLPGDPIRRIHWKLSARKDELLIREAEPEIVETERTYDTQRVDDGKRRRLCTLTLLAIILICVLTALLIPDAERSTKTLFNRIFEESERLNAYTYVYFPVPEGQSILPAAVLLSTALLTLIGLAILRRSRGMMLGIMAGITLFQIYFGIPLPGWISVPMYCGMGLFSMRRPIPRDGIRTFAATVMAVSLLVLLFIPGTDAATEDASEHVRDMISEAAGSVPGTVSEVPEGEKETRHVHTLSLRTGENDAVPDREYRMVTVEEEQISLPRIINWAKTVLMFLMIPVLLVLPFVPFVILNARKKKTLELREPFDSGNVSGAVRAVFRQVILWMRETGHDGGNLPFREWAEYLPEGMPDGYAERFAACVKDYEEASYSSHEMPEEKRRGALALLKETEETLWQTADWKQRIRIRYWMCLRE